MYSVREILKDSGINTLIDVSINQVLVERISKTRKIRELEVKVSPSVCQVGIGTFYEDIAIEDLGFGHQQTLGHIRRSLGTDQVIPYLMKENEEMFLTAKDTNYVIAKYADILKEITESGVKVINTGKNKYDPGKMRKLYSDISHIGIEELPIIGGEPWTL